MHKLKAQVERPLAPEEVRRVRKKLGLTQKEAGLLLGGGRNAFQQVRERGSADLSGHFQPAARAGTAPGGAGSPAPPALTQAFGATRTKQKRLTNYSVSRFDIL